MSASRHNKRKRSAAQKGAKPSISLSSGREQRESTEPFSWGASYSCLALVHFGISFFPNFSVRPDELTCYWPIGACRFEATEVDDAPLLTAALLLVLYLCGYRREIQQLRTRFDMLILRIEIDVPHQKRAR